MIFPSQLVGHPFFFKEGKCCNCNDEEQYAWFYFSYLYNLAISRIEWVNLPEEIEEFALEEMLFWYGACLFVKDPVVDVYAVLRLNLVGIPDIYSIPDIRIGWTPTGESLEYDKFNSVIIWDKPVLYPTYHALWLFAQRLARAHMTGDLNLLTKRTPVVAYSTEDTKLTVENIVHKIKTWVPFIKVKSGIYNPEEMIKTIDLKTDAIFLDCETFKTRVWSDALNYLGIEYFIDSKKERLTSAEGQGNSGSVEMARNTFLSPRLRAAKQINKLYGLTGDKAISVRFRSDLASFINMPDMFVTNQGTEPEEEGVDEDE